MPVTIIQNGRIRNLDDVRMVDAFLAKVKTRPMWETIDFIVKRFNERNPGVIKKYDKPMLNRFAATKDLGMRHLISMPQKLYDTIDYFYHDEIMADKKKFLTQFAKRYKVFTPAESI